MIDIICDIILVSIFIYQKRGDQLGGIVLAVLGCALEQFTGIGIVLLELRGCLLDLGLAVLVPAGREAVALTGQSLLHAGQDSVTAVVAARGRAKGLAECLQAI